MPVVLPGFIFRHVTSPWGFIFSNERPEVASELWDPLKQYTCSCISTDIWNV